METSSASSRRVSPRSARWWVGLREAEATEYEGKEGAFRSVERTYRAGFEAALRPGRRVRSWDDDAADLRREHGDGAGEPAFRRGYERGAAYTRRVREAAPVSGR